MDVGVVVQFRRDGALLGSQTADHADDRLHRDLTNVEGQLVAHQSITGRLTIVRKTAVDEVLLQDTNDLSLVGQVSKALGTHVLRNT